jgi:tRNA (guanine9-N1)-methyltransferase
MSSQLTRCHADNRRSLKPVEIFLTSLDKRLGERMETAMKGAHHRWSGVCVSTDPYEVVLSGGPLEHFVYLTADSPNVIQSLEKEKVYIIGGLVDRNRHKVLTSGFNWM